MPSFQYFNALICNILTFGIIFDYDFLHFSINLWPDGVTKRSQNRPIILYSNVWNLWASGGSAPWTLAWSPARGVAPGPHQGPYGGPLDPMPLRSARYAPTFFSTPTSKNVPRALCKIYENVPPKRVNFTQKICKHGSHCFEFLHFTQVNGAPSHPLPTGTLKQSYAAEGFDWVEISLKGTVSDPPFQTSLFSKHPDFFFFFFCIVSKNFTIITITYLYNNSLWNSTFLERETIFCCWELIFVSDN